MRYSLELWCFVRLVETEIFGVIFTSLRYKRSTRCIEYYVKITWELPICATQDKNLVFLNFWIKALVL